MSRPSTDPRSTVRSTRDAVAGRVALLGGVVFAGAYFVNDTVRGAVATRPLPLPNAPAPELLDYVRGEPLALVLPALVQVVSVAGLLLFALAVRRIAGPPASRGATAVVVAVAAMVVSAAASILEARVALPDGPTLIVHQGAFLAGGVAHVVSLGVAVALLGQLFAARGIRVLSIVVGVPALLSLISVVWFYGAAFILLGRLLAIVWVIVAGLALAFSSRPLRTVGADR